MKPSWAVMKLIEANGCRPSFWYRSLEPVSRDANMPIFAFANAGVPLAGLSRRTVIEIAATLDIPLREADIDLYDAYVAEEAFITSTSWCLVPVRSINARPIGTGQCPGPVTGRLIEGYKSRLGGFDYVAQYLRHVN